MDIPDVVGERLDIALDIIEKQCPELKYEIINPDSTKSSQETDVLYGIKRVVRQKLIEEERLELLVFLFKEEPDFV